MNRRAYGLVAGIIGAGIGTWIWQRITAHAKRGGKRPVLPFSERGTVIFANTPRPSEASL